MTLKEKIIIALKEKNKNLFPDTILESDEEWDVDITGDYVYFSIKRSLYPFPCHFEYDKLGKIKLERVLRIIN